MAPQKTVPWSVSEVTQFLVLVSDEKIQVELDGTRNEKVYRELAQRMASLGYERTFRQCREKLKKLKSDYRAIKESSGRGGSSRKTWKWFGHMDDIYGRRRRRNHRGGDAGGRARDDDSTFLEVIIDNDLSPTLESPSLEEPLSPKGDPVAPPESMATPSQHSVVDSDADEDADVSVPEFSPPKLNGRRRTPRDSDLVGVLREIHSADVVHHRVEEAQQERAVRLLELQLQQRAEHFQLALEEMRLSRETEEALRRQELDATNAFNQAFLAMLGKLVERSAPQ
ncbi:zinc finger and SCAN domain-containing protein 20-like isoform X2 [Phyllopteryx taeniolatus]|uniref:zinc finger and SCAN domain-containing protein 20-like isoform X2 n=1 Tax=Phyllopteryx taeniolatus TaxID=161469 RepID=UPI002AD31AFC|nr:zinc finger and SCAN domain-containing protein 20-like isoform X2 [Phyllopteryx taeniolatus]